MSLNLKLCFMLIGSLMIGCGSTPKPKPDPGKVLLNKLQSQAAVRFRCNIPEVQVSHVYGPRADTGWIAQAKCGSKKAEFQLQKNKTWVESILSKLSVTIMSTTGWDKCTEADLEPSKFDPIAGEENKSGWIVAIRCGNKRGQWRYDGPEKGWNRKY